jgi:polyisoprenoid-binding protein YceI
VVSIHARSSVHPIDGRASAVTGTVEAELVDVGDGGIALTGGRLEVPIEALKSGNPLEDAELKRRVDARRFPTIAGEMRSASALGSDGRFRVEGDLTFHGVTKSITDELRVTREGDQLRIEGEHTFDIRDFGVKPPRILLLRVYPEVQVRIELVAEPS